MKRRQEFIRKIKVFYKEGKFRNWLQGSRWKGHVRCSLRRTRGGREEGLGIKNITKRVETNAVLQKKKGSYVSRRRGGKELLTRGDK